MVDTFMLTVMRHLPTAGNKQKQYIGWTDEPILDVSKASYQLPWQPETVYCSDLLRCKQSAQLYFPNAQCIEDPRFRETNFGEWEGKTYDMLKEIKTYRQWIDDPFGNQPPKGESIQQVERRLLQALKDLPAGDNHHFIVTHGGPIRIVLTLFSPEKTDFWSWSIPHFSVWQLTWENETAFREGKRCTSISAVPITANPTT